MAKPPQAPAFCADLLPRGSKWLIGVSGGADSVALLRLLAARRRDQAWRFVVAHLDHGLRGRAAAADARFVGRLAKSLRLPFVHRRVEVARLAAKRRWSLEQAAREARLDFFAAEARRRGATGVILAHTRDDQAETLLIRLLRGAGAQGLAAMRETQQVRGLTIARPLLRAERSALRSYLAGLGQAWREDASNADPRFLRNRIRNEIIPHLERTLHRPLRSALCRSAELIGEEEADWRIRVEAVRSRHGDAAGRLRVRTLAGEGLAVQRRLLHQWLCERLGEGDFETVERVRNSVAGEAGARSTDVGGGWRTVVERGWLELRRPRTEPPLPEVPLRKSGKTPLGAWGICARVKRGRGPLPHAPQRLGAVPAQIALALARAEGAQLTVRPWRAGDRLRPAGGGGSRKLQDVFTDARLPREERHRVPVLAADGAPVWIPGHRPAEGWEVRDASAPAWHIRLEPAKPPRL